MRKEYIRQGTEIRALSLIFDEKEFYIRTDCEELSLAEMIQQATEHFSQYGIVFDMSRFNITCENIHIDCLGYDGYDGFDYGNYIIITKI